MKAFLDDICAALRSALATWRTMRALRKGTNPDESF